MKGIVSTTTWMAWLLSALLPAATRADVGPIKGYPQVDVQELSPFTLNWNEVHYLVRESLLEIDELRALQDDFYEELYECFGLEKCLRQGNVMDGPPQIGGQLGAGALLASMRTERQNLRLRHSQLASSINQIRQQVTSSSRGGGGGVSSYSNRTVVSYGGTGGRGGIQTVSSSFRSSRTRGGGGSGSAAGRGGSYSYSSQSSYSNSFSRGSSSSSSSSGGFGGYPGYEDYDQGPQPNRG